MITWLHHLFNPHCEHCDNRVDEKDKIIDLLREQLERERAEKARILDRFITKQLEPIAHEPSVNEEKFVQINPKHTPWSVRKQQLEAKHRLSDEARAHRVAEVNKLAEKLGLDKIDEDEKEGTNG